MKFVSFENIDYNELDKILLSLHFVKKHNKAKIEYANCACSFDTETTSTRVHNKKVALTYFWQFALTEKFFCYGRTWQEFRTLINYISSRLSLNPGHALICYVHNLGFEFQFFRKWFFWASVFSVKDRTPIKAMTEQGIEFRDSYILSGLPLRLVAENLTSHKIKKLVGDLDYSLVRTDVTSVTDKELGYMLNDVVILIYYINEQIDQYGDISKVPLTNTGRVRMAVRQKAFSKDNRYLTQKQISLLTLTPELYNKLKRAFAGGFTHANHNYVGKIVQNVQSMDFTSSYPTVLLSSNRYPMSKPLEYNFTDNETFINDLHNERLMFFFNATFENLLTKIDFENYISKSKCFDFHGLVENNGRVWMAERLSVTICSIDFEIIEQCYQWTNVIFSDITMYTCDYLPRYMLESVIHFYQQKTTLKGIEGKEREYLLYKGMLNSVYGMTVTDIAKPEITYVDEWGKELVDLPKVIEDYNNDKNRFLYYAWGVVVTALARQNLWTGILELGQDYVYSDTDSVKFINSEKHRDYFQQYNKDITEKLKKMCEKKGFNYKDLEPKTVSGIKKPLGVWDNDGYYSHFKTLGAKRYVLIENGKLHTTIAGLGKKAGAEYLLKISNNNPLQALKNFKVGLFVPAGETGKNTHTYIDEEWTGNVTDYQGITKEINTLSGVYLEPASFRMTISKSFAEFLADIVTTGHYEINGVNYD